MPRPPRNARRLIALHEQIEDAWKHRRVDAVPVVFDANHRVPALSLHLQMDVRAAR